VDKQAHSLVESGVYSHCFTRKAQLLYQYLIFMKKKTKSQITNQTPKTSKQKFLARTNYPANPTFDKMGKHLGIQVWRILRSLSSVDSPSFFLACYLGNQNKAFKVLKSFTNNL
jgi:hypothetical protein